MKVYIEPKPKGRHESDSIDYYAIEMDGGASVDGKNYATQTEARESAKRQGHYPILCARVRITDKGKPDHWRSCE